ncbi:UNVERIFIED_CONTAM: hypothetical protein K2H54_014094 [Gekko kuhli]
MIHRTDIPPLFLGGTQVGLLGMSPSQARLAPARLLYLSLSNHTPGLKIRTAVEEACAVPAGFYWQTVETDEKYFTGSSDIKESGDTDTEVAMALLLETLLRNPRAVHHMLQLVLASGLDICGLRLLYPPHSMLLSSAVTLPPSYAPEKELPVLAVSLRGSNARGVLQDIVGPSDPRLASVTDSCSINASYCASPAQPLVYLPRTDGRVHRELCVWFGGRVCHEEVPCGGAQHPVCKCRKRR